MKLAALLILYLYRPIRVRFGRLVAVEVWPEPEPITWAGGGY